MLVLIAKNGVTSKVFVEFLIAVQSFIFYTEIPHL